MADATVLFVVALLGRSNGLVDWADYDFTVVGLNGRWRAAGMVRHG